MGPSDGGPHLGKERVRKYSVLSLNPWCAALRFREILVQARPHGAHATQPLAL